MTSKKENIEKKLREAAKSVVKGFVFSDFLPEEIILCNADENLELFKSFLEQELHDGEYKVPVIVDERKKGYAIDVRNYLIQFIK